MPLATPPPAETTPSDSSLAGTSLPSPSARLTRRTNLLWLDQALVALAFLSLGIFLALYIGRLNPEEDVWLRYVDYAAILLFGLGFLGKVLSAEDAVWHLRHNWYEIIAFLPITLDLFQLGRWFFLLQIAIVFTRFSEALDRAFGERVFRSMFERYKSALIEELTAPLLLRLVSVIQMGLARGRYMETLGRKLDSRRPEIHAIVLKAVEANPKVARLYQIPAVQDKVRDAVEGVVDSAVASLTSEELHQIVSQALYEVFEELKTEIDKKSWKEQGVGVMDVTKGLLQKPDAQ